MPSFFSFLPARRPGVSAGTRKAVMPRALGTSGLLSAYTRYRPAWPPLVIQLLVPLSTNASPSRRACVLMFDASEPEVGSLRQYAPTYVPCASAGRNRCFWSDVPKRTIGSHTSELLTDMTTECEASAHEISSMPSA